MAKTASLPFKGNFQHTQGFGANPDRYAKYGISGHDGDDWAVPEFTPIYSPFKGVILRDRFDPQGWGSYLWVWDKEQHLIMNIAHLNSTPANELDGVFPGTLIGYSGNTGNSDFPHVHVAVADVDDSGNRLNTNNGYRGWRSILGDINLVPLPAEGIQTNPASTTATPPAGPAGAPQTPQILRPHDNESTYGIVPEIELSDVAEAGRPTPEYRVVISSAIGGFDSGWRTSRIWKPPITNFNNINYSVAANARWKVGTEYVESGHAPGIGFRLYPEVPPPSARLPDGKWEPSSNTEYDSGKPGIYARFDGGVWRTQSSIRYFGDPDSGGNDTRLNDEGRAEFASRGGFYGTFMENPPFGGDVKAKIGINEGWSTKGYGISSLIASKQEDAKPAQPPAVSAPQLTTIPQSSPQPAPTPAPIPIAVTKKPSIYKRIEQNTIEILRILNGPTTGQ